jgi:outer membrane protein assembly factor BamB
MRSSAVEIAGDRLYVGTRDGRLLAIDPKDGTRLWAFAAGDTISSTSLLASGRVYFGSFDGNVYALDAATGALIWKQATGAAVTSTPARYGDLVIVGSRSYDLFAFDGATGKVAWKTYYWYSWVESPGTVLGTSIYTGSSDAAKVFALDAASGRRLWDFDIGGSAWGQPAVTETRIFAGAAGVLNYLVPHRATALALDRATGRPVWRHPIPPPAGAESAATAYGFAGSPALGDELVYFPCIDGRVYAFRQ